MTTWTWPPPSRGCRPCSSCAGVLPDLRRPSARTSGRRHRARWSQLSGLDLHRPDPRPGAQAVYAPSPAPGDRPGGRHPRLRGPGPGGARPRRWPARPGRSSPGATPRAGARPVAGAERIDPTPRAPARTTALSARPGAGRARLQAGGFASQAAGGEVPGDRADEGGRGRPRRGPGRAQVAGEVASVMKSVSTCWSRVGVWRSASHFAATRGATRAGGATIQPTRRGGKRTLEQLPT